MQTGSLGVLNAALNVSTSNGSAGNYLGAPYFAVIADAALAGQVCDVELEWVEF